MSTPDPQPIDIQSMLDFSGEPMLILAADGQILHANRAFEALLGYPQAEVQDQPWGSLLSAPSAATMTVLVAALAGTKQGSRLDVVALHKDGGRLDLDVILVPINLFALPSPNPTDVFVMLRDITVQKHAQEQQQTLIHGLREVLASAADLMACPDLDSTYRSTVEFARERLGIERCALFLVDEDGLVSGTYGTNMRGETTEEYRNGFQMWEVSKVPPEWQVTLHDPHWNSFDDIYYSWEDGQAVKVGQGWICLSPVQSTTGLIGIMNNDAAISGAPLDESKQEVLSVYCSLIGKIIEHKRYEDDIHRTLEKEHELGDLKSRLIQSVSHEFRTPFAVILTSTHVLRRYSDRISEARAAVHWNTIEQQVEHMTSLLEELLTIEKMDRHHLSFSPTALDLLSFCSSLTQRFAIRAAPTHQIDFAWEGNQPIRLVDKWLLDQILTNLLANAISYSPEGGTIQLKLACTAETARFEVSDHGIGISPDDQEHIFDLFHRGRNAETIRGIGLGLSIVQRGVLAHGGTITFETQEGAGTTFSVTLPAPPPASTQAQGQP